MTLTRLLNACLPVTCVSIDMFGFLFAFRIVVVFVGCVVGCSKTTRELHARLDTSNAEDLSSNSNCSTVCNNQTFKLHYTLKRVTDEASPSSVIDGIEWFASSTAQFRLSGKMPILMAVVRVAIVVSNYTILQLRH